MLGTPIWPQRSGRRGGLPESSFRSCSEPVLQTEVAGGWQVAVGRVTLIEDRLTGLESAAPDEARASRARALRDAVRAARQSLDTALVSRDPTTLARDLAAIAAQLSATLEAPARTS